ncbi:hypothetical protein [Streptomyces sp. NPDC059994]|uniref:hypothetical protein n=1 Tax=Streptomyces sp. NPDC059994 TaxID=3347029 RepID=UPI003674CA00
MGRTNRDAYTIRISGSACEVVVISWAREAKGACFSLSYVLSWQPEDKTWIQMPDTSGIEKALKAAGGTAGEGEPADPDRD